MNTALVAPVGLEYVTFFIVSKEFVKTILICYFWWLSWKLLVSAYAPSSTVYKLSHLIFVAILEIILV